VRVCIRIQGQEQTFDVVYRSYVPCVLLRSHRYTDVHARRLKA